MVGPLGHVGGDVPQDPLAEPAQVVGGKLTGVIDQHLGGLVDDGPGVGGQPRQCGGDRLDLVEADQPGGEGVPDGRWGTLDRGRQHGQPPGAGGRHVKPLP